MLHERGSGASCALTSSGGLNLTSLFLISYTRHTSRFLTTWALLLPLGIWDADHYAAIICTSEGREAGCRLAFNGHLTNRSLPPPSPLPVAPIISFLLFGVDQIGVQLEQPFAVLPLDLLVDKVKFDAAEMCEQHYDLAAELAAPALPVDGADFAAAA